MTKRNRRKEDPYASIRRRIPPPDFPMGTKKYNRKNLENRTKEIIDQGIKDYYEEEFVGSMVGNLNKSTRRTRSNFIFKKGD